MTLAEAEHRASSLGLSAVVDVSGWSLLVRPGVRLEARGSDWKECFARYEQLRADEARAAEAPQPARQGDLFEGLT